MQDRLETFKDSSGTDWTFKYTANGELLEKFETNTPANNVIYSYDALGNLTHVDFPGTANDIEYIIDGLNRRVGKKVDGSLIKQWLYKDQLNIIAELDGAGAITKRFVYASKVNVPDYYIDYTGPAPVTYRIISDHLGSPRTIINSTSGVSALDLEYDAWVRNCSLQ